MTYLFNRLAILILIWLIGAATLPGAAAQTSPTQLSALAVELWPDYDRPSMLVLLTATLAEGTTLPATLVIPLPENAEIHAVASFNEAGALMSDVDYSAENGQMTLTTPSSRFRVEYYEPYAVDGNEYSHTFEWLSDLSIDQMTVVIQQPLAATSFQTTPAAVSSAASRGDNLTYHTLPSRSVAANEPVTVTTAYTVEAPVLSAPSQTVPGAPAATSPTAEAGTGGATGIGIDPLWLLLAIAGALALIGGAWYLGQRQGRSTNRARKPQPTRPAKSRPAKESGGGAKYCHNCGKAAQSGDVFCRYCGVELKS